MNKINLFSLALLAAAGTVFTSCQKDEGEEVNPVITQENNVPDGTSKMIYSVQVRPSSEDARIAGLSGAKVTVNQGGSLRTVTTDASGIATFDDMRQGQVSVFVQADGYLSYNTSDYIDCYECDYEDLDTEQTEYDQMNVYLPKRGATVNGAFYGDFDGDGWAYVDDNDDRMAGVTVKFVVSNNYEPNVFTATTDASGKYTLTNLPEGVEGTLSVVHNIETTNTTGADEFKQTEVYTYTGFYAFNVKTPSNLGNLALSKTTK